MNVDFVARVLGEMMRAQANRVLTLHEGQVLQARVLDFIDGKALLQMAGEKIIADKEIPLTKGDEIVFRVKNLEGDQIQLQVITEKGRPESSLIISSLVYSSGELQYSGEIIIEEEDSSEKQKKKEEVGYKCIVVFNTEHLGFIQVALHYKKETLDGKITVFDEKVQEYIQEKLTTITDKLSKQWQKIQLSCRFQTIDKNAKNLYNNNPAQNLFDLRI